MSTKMTETDWANTLEVFRACLPRRGRKAADDLAVGADASGNPTGD